jgi:general stress protein YciG
MAKKKDPAAVALGRRGGKARLKTMTSEQRSEIARKAGQASSAARWGKKEK